MAKKADEAKNAKLMDDRAKALETTLASLEKQFGKGTVMKLGEQAHMKVDVVPTGCLELDLALGVGGIPKGRIIEIYGPESSGTSQGCVFQKHGIGHSDFSNIMHRRCKCKIRYHFIIKS